ncbi:MAG TPA: CHAD domain-containing protein [Solirubrobacterales bacterium]
MARAREIPDLDCDAPFAEAAARVIALRADELFEHSEGVLDTGDIERVHDMRVATRRLRAAMEIFETCFPPKRWRRALRRVKALADSLGERRDRDVAIEFLAGFSGEVRGPDRDRLETVIGSLREEQREANDGLAPAVDAKRLMKLRRRLDKLVAAAGE